MKKLHNTQGFTIIELLIATLVVSMLLLLCVYGLAQVARFFTKGVTSATTQEVTRTVLEDITGRIQVEQNLVFGPIDTATSRTYCVGTMRYSYNIASVEELTEAAPLTAGARMLSREELNKVPVIDSECTSNLPVEDSLTDLLKDNMRVVDFSITKPPLSSGRLYTVSLKVLYAPDDAALAQIVYLPDETRPDDVRCSGARGAEFCGLSSLTTTVFRLNECTYCKEEL